MPDSFIDLVVTSPPYDGLRKYNGYSFEFEKICHSLFRVIKDGGVCVWVIGDETKNGGESLTSFKQALYFVECCGFKLFDTMIYAKPPRGAVGNNKTYWQSFEYMFVFSKTKPKTLNLIRDRKNKECRDGDSGTKRLTDGSLLKVKRNGYGEYGRRTNIWEYGTGKGQSTKDNIAFLHPSIFPEQLAKDHIMSWSNEGDLVYDCFMGSGTVAKMCRQTGRNFIGSETSNEYCGIINKRINAELF